jgi:hypothetical protein
VSEYVGQELDDITLDIVLHSGLGVEPLTEVYNIKNMIDSAEQQNVFLNAKFYGKYTLRNMDSEETHWYKGRPAIIKVSLTMKEYVESVPFTAEIKLREEELKRNRTGLGGPEKVAGVVGAEAIKARVLTKIN